MKVTMQHGDVTKEIKVGEKTKWIERKSDGSELEVEGDRKDNLQETFWPMPESDNAWVDRGPHFKYEEDRFLDEVREYIASTYDQHYVGSDKERTQVVDLWESLGSLDTTSRDTAIKYLSRYGKKGGHNKVDLMKAIHYTILLWYATEDKQ